MQTLCIFEIFHLILAIIQTQHKMKCFILEEKGGDKIQFFFYVVVKKELISISFYMQNKLAQTGKNKYLT